ncbi:hypothetical protein SCHPADRAFT_410976 [Schizopora paradoxa]|uniref:MYND-type domain-containing protein n=1 Tax=Schizopora paradoxa TaxID=27342 RepID=A0A0H2RL19_9AGAM|nr:hypothetical protein SCHPADRAFT_410976 [Schizopora paradoxa]
MHCVNAACMRCKVELILYLSDPRPRIASAAGSNSTSLEDLRTVVAFGAFTPARLIEEVLSMFFSHLSAGDQSTFDPTKPLPPHLRTYETRSFLAMAGIFIVFNKYYTPKTIDAAPVKPLARNWTKIWKWIQYFLYRALARTVPPAEAPITPDEASFTNHGEEYVTLNMVVVVVTLISYEPSVFETVVANDGTYDLVLKLWAQTVFSNAAASTNHYRRVTVLVASCFKSLKGPDASRDMQSKLLHEVGGDWEPLIAFLLKPLRSAAKCKTSSDLYSQISHLESSISLIKRLSENGSEGSKGSVFGKAFFNPKLNLRPLVVNVLKKYTAMCDNDHPRFMVLLAVRAIFHLCLLFFLYQGAAGFVVKLLGDGILDAYANLASGLRGLTDHVLEPAVYLLNEDISTFLTDEIVITAAKNALHRLEKDRKTEYQVLKETTSGLKEAWLYFTGHVTARVVLKGFYDSQYRKEDKRSCVSCWAPMTERMLRKCSGCRFVYYCSRECQREDWGCHKQRCKSLAVEANLCKTKADASHFRIHLATLDIRRHLPGFLALAQRNPLTCSDDALLAFCINYLHAPPQFTVFPAEDIANDENCLKYTGNLAFDQIEEEERARRSRILDKAREGKGTLWIVQIICRGYGGGSFSSFEILHREDFEFLPASVMQISHPNRPRAVDEDGNALAIQCDFHDIVITDAIFGRTLSENELGLYAEGSSSQLDPNSADQAKTFIERVDDAVRTRHRLRTEALEQHLGCEGCVECSSEYVPWKLACASPTIEA